MPQCDFYDSCLLRRELSDIAPRLIKGYNVAYCNGDYHGCAIHRVVGALGVDSVPQDLLPTNNSRADDLIRRGSRKS